MDVEAACPQSHDGIGAAIFDPNVPDGEKRFRHQGVVSLPRKPA
jgi:hypothetical protein